jgi:hypothetical protein
MMQGKNQQFKEISVRKGRKVNLYLLTISTIVASLFLPIIAHSEVEADDPPYPQSPVILELEWAPESTIERAAQGSDNFPITWGDDDYLYTAYGDGRGFEPKVPDKLSMGFARVSGMPNNFEGENIRSNAEETGDGDNARKVSGLLMVDDTLYMWARNANRDGEHCKVAVSDDYAKTWTYAEWTFEEFGYCAFVQYGKNYDGAPDEYVYMVTPDTPSSYRAADDFVLTRVPKDRIMERSAYEFFVSVNSSNKATWSSDINDRGSVFHNPGKARRSSMSYNAALGRYLWWQGHPSTTDRDERYDGGIGIFDAPTPWGPWTTVYYVDDWDVGPGDTATFPTKWMSGDGKTIHLVFSGDDFFSVRKAALTIDNAGSGTALPSTPAANATPAAEPEVAQIRLQVTNTSNDVEELNNGSIHIYSADLDMAQANNASQLVGIRFPDLRVPSGATIQRAYLEFAAMKDEAGETQLQIAAELSQDSEPFQAISSDLSRRSRTQQTIYWQNAESWSMDAVYRSPDLTSVVQEVVDQDGWQSGNAISFIIGGSGKRTARSYDSSPQRAPTLVVTYRVAREGAQGRFNKRVFLPLAPK